MMIMMMMMKIEGDDADVDDDILMMTIGDSHSRDYSNDVDYDGKIVCNF